MRCDTTTLKINIYLFERMCILHSLEQLRATKLSTHQRIAYSIQIRSADYYSDNILSVYKVCKQRIVNINYAF